MLSWPSQAGRLLTDFGYFCDVFPRLKVERSAISPDVYVSCPSPAPLLKMDFLKDESALTWEPDLLFVPWLLSEVFAKVVNYVGLTCHQQRKAPEQAHLQRTH